MTGQHFECRCGQAFARIQYHCGRCGQHTDIRELSCRWCDASRQLSRVRQEAAS